MKIMFYVFSVCSVAMWLLTAGVFFSIYFGNIIPFIDPLFGHTREYMIMRGITYGVLSIVFTIFPFQIIKEIKKQKNEEDK